MLAPWKKGYDQPRHYTGQKQCCNKFNKKTLEKFKKKSDKVHSKDFL